MNRVLAIAHFPPPVQGMAVAVDAFVGLLEKAALDERTGVDIVRWNIAGDRQRRTIANHLQRLTRVISAGAALWRDRRSSKAYISVDAGPGMLYTLSLVVLARLGGVRTYLHHHSAAYFRSRRLIFATMCSIGGPVVSHLVGCDAMADELSRSYPRARVQVLPILYAIDDGGTRGAKRIAPENGSDPQRPVTLGHLSNLTAAKGFELVFDTMELLIDRGVESRLLLAGAAPTGSERAIFERRLAVAGARARYMGAVYGERREAFFDELDVFLFPSRYRHESFGLVVGEALARGIPVVTFATTCIDAVVLGPQGLVVGAGDHFPQRAADWLVAELEVKDRAKTVFDGEAAFAHQREDAIARAYTVARGMLVGGWRPNHSAGYVATPLPHDCTKDSRDLVCQPDWTSRRAVRRSRKSKCISSDDPEVTLVGYFGRGNLGDDAMLAGLTEFVGGFGLATVEPVPLPRRSLAEIPAMARLVARLKRSDAMILVGGTHFHDSFGRRAMPILVAHVMLVWLARLCGVKVGLAGVGVGPLRFSVSRWSTRAIFRATTAAFVRDQASLDELKTLRVDGRVGLGADLATLMTPNESKAAASSSYRLGVSVVPYFGAYQGQPELDDLFVSVLAGVIATVAQERPLGVRILALNRTGRFTDLRVSRHLHAELEARAVRTELVDVDDPREFATEVTALDGLIASRYHAALFAHLRSKQMLVVAYEAKCEALASQIGLSPDAVMKPIEALSTKRLHTLLGKMVEDRSQFRGESPAGVISAEAASAASALLATLGLRGAK